MAYARKFKNSTQKARTGGVGRVVRNLRPEKRGLALSI